MSKENIFLTFYEKQHYGYEYYYAYQNFKYCEDFYKKFEVSFCINIDLDKGKKMLNEYFNKLLEIFIDHHDHTFKNGDYTEKKILFDDKLNYKYVATNKKMNDKDIINSDQLFCEILSYKVVDMHYHSELHISILSYYNGKMIFELTVFLELRSYNENTFTIHNLKNMYKKYCSMNDILSSAFVKENYNKYICNDIIKIIGTFIAIDIIKFIDN